MTDIKPKKIIVKDAALDDNKIPRNLILKYGETPYVMKAGLEWKAAKMFGNGGYGLKLEFIDRKPEYVLVKATMTIKATGAEFENYGEASKENVNSMMQKQILHLALTRAECRVLRMATACGYASYDEIMTQPKALETDIKQAALPVDENKPATDQQKDNIRKLIGHEALPEEEKKLADEWINDLTFTQAGQKMVELAKAKKEKKNDNA